MGIDDPEDNADGIKIAIVTCAFDNRKVINWLKQRGNAIKFEKWDKLDEINETIRMNLKKDSVLLDQLQRPCAIFVTF